MVYSKDSAGWTCSQNSQSHRPPDYCTVHVSRHVQLSAVILLLTSSEMNSNKQRIKCVFPTGGKESACQCRRCKRCSFNPWVRKIPWRRKWQPTPVFLPSISHTQRSLMGYSSWDVTESDTTEHTCTRFPIWRNPMKGCLETFLERGRGGLRNSSI